MATGVHSLTHHELLVVSLGSQGCRHRSIALGPVEPSEPAARFVIDAILQEDTKPFTRALANNVRIGASTANVDETSIRRKDLPKTDQTVAKRR